MPEIRRVIIIGISDIENTARLQLITKSLAEIYPQTICIAGSRSHEPKTLLESKHLIAFALPFSLPKRVLNIALRCSAAMLSQFSSSAWHSLFVQQSHQRKLQQALKVVKLSADDVVLCSHWSALPLVGQEVLRSGAKLIFDENEASRSEHADRNLVGPMWTSLAASAQRDRVVEHAAIISPCTSYRKALVDYLYDVDVAGEVVRNVQPVQNVFAPTIDHHRPLKISYQGLALANRNLDAVIRSAADWPKETLLDLQLVGKLASVSEIVNLATDSIPAKRLAIVTPVPAMNIATSLATRHVDIGLCVFDPSLPQLSGSLPNKFFAYLAAGAAVIAVRGTACSDVIEANDIGYVIDDIAEKSLTACVYGIVSDPSTLARKRANAHAFALQNTWEVEALRLHRIVEEVIEFKR